MIKDTLFFILLSIVSQSLFGQLNGVSVGLKTLSFDIIEDIESFDIDYDWNTVFISGLRGVNIGLKKELSNKFSLTPRIGIATGSQNLSVLDIQHDSEFINGEYIYDETLPHIIQRKHRYLYGDLSLGVNYYLKDGHKGLYFTVAPNIFYLMGYNKSEQGFNDRIIVSMPPTEKDVPSVFNKFTAHILLRSSYSFRIVNRFEIDLGFHTSVKLNSFYNGLDISNRLFSFGGSLHVGYLLSNAIKTEK